MQSTTKSYLSSMCLAHAWQGLDCVKFKSDKILNMIYVGAKTLNSCNVTIVDKRRATTAFLGSVRMGEMLCSSTQLKPNSLCFTWNDVKFISKDEMLLMIPFSKTNKLRGDYVDIFSFNYFGCCPVASLSSLMICSNPTYLFSCINLGCV
jgi:hypothetical protein